MGNGESWEWGGRFPAVDEIGVRRQGADCLIDSPFPITTVRLSCRRCPLTHFERTPYRRRRPASISIRPVALSHLTVWGWFNACGSNGLRAVDGLPAAAHLRRLRRPLSGRLQGPGVFLSRS